MRRPVLTNLDGVRLSHVSPRRDRGRSTLFWHGRSVGTVEPGVLLPPVRRAHSFRNRGTRAESVPGLRWSVATCKRGPPRGFCCFNLDDVLLILPHTRSTRSWTWWALAWPSSWRWPASTVMPKCWTTRSPAGSRRTWPSRVRDCQSRWAEDWLRRPPPCDSRQ